MKSMFGGGGLMMDGRFGRPMERPSPSLPIDRAPPTSGKFTSSIRTVLSFVRLRPGRAVSRSPRGPRMGNGFLSTRIVRQRTMSTAIFQSLRYAQSSLTADCIIGHGVESGGQKVCRYYVE